MSDKSMMFELWTECNNLCKFCYLGKKNRKTSDNKKLKNLRDANKIIQTHFKEDPEQYKAVGLIGGEFFQGQLNTPEIKENFFCLCKNIFKLIEEDKVRDFWCYCTLTIGDQEDLYKLVELFDQCITDKEKHHFWILVSYDTWGRFYVPGRKENWEKHMLNLQKYPFIHFNVTSILSNDFCEKVLSGEHNLLEFREKFKCTYFFKQPTKTNDYSKKEFAALHENWFLKRKVFIDFLKKLKADDIELFNEVLNIIQRADDIYQGNENGFNAAHRDKITWYEDLAEGYNPKCGHVVNYQCYSDSDACCLCDYFKVKGDN